MPIVARDPAILQSELNALQAAINTGALRVHFADRDVTYRYLSEMIKIRDNLVAELTQVSGVRRIRRVGFATSAGYDGPVRIVSIS